MSSKLVKWISIEVLGKWVLNGKVIKGWKKMYIIGRFKIEENNQRHGGVR